MVREAPDVARRSATYTLLHLPTDPPRSVAMAMAMAMAPSNEVSNDLALWTRIGGHDP